MSHIKYPETIAFYKKTAELQVKLKKPDVDDQGRIIKGKEGCLFFEMAKAIPNDPDGRIDWNSKIIMKIGMNDVASILYYLEGNGTACKLFHKTQLGSSSFEMAPGQNDSHGVKIFKKTNDVNLNAQLYLSGADASLLREVIKSAIPVILGYL